MKQFDLIKGGFFPKKKNYLTLDMNMVLNTVVELLFIT